MKKKFSMLTIALAASLGLVACGTGEGDKGTTTNGEAKIKVGMMTDSGTIDDKSFNQGTWEGIKRYESENGTIEAQYIKPGGEATQDYLEAADNLLAKGNELIIAPGFKFEEAIGKLQAENPETKFVILDGEPEGGVAENSVGIYFAEQEAGFLAGIAAALETKTGKVGFIGGMKSESIEKFGYGYVAGVAYANKHFGTNAEVVDYLYNGTFTDVAGGQAQAGSMYDKGIDIIFTAAGRVGSGVITEAKTRAEAGDKVYVIGVDVDQYEDGIYNQETNESVILTSALKRVDNASYTKVDEFINGTFTGGEVITMTAEVDGVGLPETNPNLTTETQETVNELLANIKAGNLVIPSTEADVQSFLSEMGYQGAKINF